MLGIEIQDIKQVNIAPVEKVVLSNGLQVHHIQCTTEQPLIMEAIFPAGKIWEKQKSIAYATNQLIKEGTTIYSGGDIQEIMDFYGTQLKVSMGMDMASIGMKTLDKHVTHVFPVFESILCGSLMPAHELLIFKRNKKNELIYDLQSSDVVAYRTLSEAIFGSDHPYGYNSNLEDYQKITRSAVLSFYKKHYKLGRSEVILCSHNGKILNKLSDLKIGKASKNNQNVPKIFINKPKEVEVNLPNKTQSVILMGCKVPGKRHPDYAGIFVLNTILGGYFGSRLVADLREKRGLAYHIYSSLDCMQKSAMLVIGMETNRRNLKKSLLGVNQNLLKLIENPINNEELRMTKNYLMGQIMGHLDGPVRITNLLKSLVFEGVDLSYITHLIQEIQNINSERIRILASRYLNPKNLTKVIVT